MGLALLHRGGEGGHLRTGSIGQDTFYLGDTGGYFRLYREVAVGIGQDMDVLQAALLARIEVYAARNAAQAPEVLVLQVGAVAPAEDFHGDDVLSRTDEFGDVEPGLQLAVLAVAHHFAVHPHAHVGSGAADAQVHRFALPGGVQVKHTAVLPHVIPLFRDDGRRIGREVSPRKADVHVHRVSEAVELPHAGHGHLPPGGVVIVHHLEAFQAAFHRRTAVETPAAVQRQGLLLVGGESGPHGQAVFFKNIRILPGLQFAGLQGKDGTQGQGCGY